MSFKDDFSSMMSRGAATVGRTTKQLGLQSKANELRRQRQTLVAQLGASLYETVRADPALRAGREELIAQIEALDEQRRQVDYEQEKLKTEGEIAAQNAATVRCAVCGAPMRVTDQFCSTCGATADRAMPNRTAPQPNVGPAVPSGPTCPNCGAPVAADDAFCMNCGKPIVQVTVAPTPASVPQYQPQQPQPQQPQQPQYAPPTMETVAPPAVESVSFTAVDEVAPIPFQPSEPIADPVVDVEEFGVADMDETVVTDDIGTEDEFASVEVSETEPPTDDRPPVTNEELESEVEFDIAEELNVENMMEELRDELHDDAPAVADETVSTTVTVETEAPGLRVCPECGEVVPDGDLFCMNCGHRFEVEPEAPASAPASRFCSNCGAEVEEGFKFCGKCGAPVE